MRYIKGILSCSLVCSACGDDPIPGTDSGSSSETSAADESESTAAPLDSSSEGEGSTSGATETSVGETTSDAETTSDPDTTAADTSTGESTSDPETSTGESSTTGDQEIDVCNPQGLSYAGTFIDEDATVNPGTYAAPPGYFDVALDPTRGRVFLSRGGDDEVEIVDLTSGSSATIATGNAAEHLFYDEGRDEMVVTLPLAGHSPWQEGEEEGCVGTIEADTLALVPPSWIPLDPWDVVSDSASHAYVVGASGQWTFGLALNLDTGAHALHTGGPIWERTTIDIHPALDRIYGVDSGLSPSDIERYDVDAGAMTYAYDSPYHGDYPMCGDLRVHPNGATIYTACGHVFQATNVAASDMTWTGNLGITWSDLVFVPGLARGVMLVEDAPQLFVFDTTTLQGVGVYPLSSPVQRILAGPDYLVLVRDVLGGAPHTELEVVPYDEVLAAQPDAEGIFLDDDVSVEDGSHTGPGGVFDVVLDTVRGRVFMSRGQTGEVEVVDLTAGASATIETPYRAEHMHFDPIGEEVFVALPIADHSPYWWDEDQEGYAASIDANSLALSPPRWFPLDPWELVANGEGPVQVTGASGQWTSTMAVDLASGWFTVDVTPGFRNGSSVELHPDLVRVYAADNDLSPSDIERYDIVDGHLDYVGDSPYHGEYPMCGDLRIHPGGESIFTRCGHVFAASNDAMDMTWRDDLGVTWSDLVFDPSGASAYVITDGSSTVTEYETATLTPVDTRVFPTNPFRLLAGPTYLVVLRPVPNGTELEVLSYDAF